VAVKLEEEAVEVSLLEYKAVGEEEWSQIQSPHYPFEASGQCGWCSSESPES